MADYTNFSFMRPGNGEEPKKKQPQRPSKAKIKEYDMGKYVLLLADNATEIFKHYDVKEMHGLNMADAQAEEIDKTKGNGVYFEGFTNYSPHDKKLTAKAPHKPFLCLNMSVLNKKSNVDKALAVMHETIHLALLLNNWNVDEKEEEISTMAEEEAKKICKKMGVA
jgi:hypothetical protein